ncbi:hypothetical protein D3C71_1955000 [compost metagenome]
MTGLGRHERDGVASGKGGAPDLARPAVDAARQIDGNDRNAAGIDPFYKVNDVVREVA